jgi:hypothetical protein
VVKEGQELHNLHAAQSVIQPELYDAMGAKVVGTVIYNGGPGSSQPKTACLCPVEVPTQARDTGFGYIAVAHQDWGYQVCSNPDQSRAIQNGCKHRSNLINSSLNLCCSYMYQVRIYGSFWLPFLSMK